MQCINNMLSKCSLSLMNLYMYVYGMMQHRRVFTLCSKKYNNMHHRKTLLNTLQIKLCIIIVSCIVTYSKEKIFPNNFYFVLKKEKRIFLMMKSVQRSKNFTEARKIYEKALHMHIEIDFLS